MRAMTAMAVVAVADLETNRAQRLRMLLEQYEGFVEKHGALLDDPTGVSDALKVVQGRRSRVAVLQSQITEIHKEIRWLEAEIDGREAAVEAMLRELLGRWERLVLDAWMPTPVLGYRMWSIEPSGLRGARVFWPTRKLTARCATSRRGRLPHSDGRCGRLGCGIYVTKELNPLLRAFLPTAGPRYVVGVTALSGKVVEHEKGYRGEHGELVAACAVLGNDMLATADVAIIDELCAAPMDTMVEHGSRPVQSVRRQIEDFLTAYAERSSSWTLDASSG